MTCPPFALSPPASAVAVAHGITLPVSVLWKRQDGAALFLNWQRWQRENAVELTREKVIAMMRRVDEIMAEDKTPGWEKIQ